MLCKCYCLAVWITTYFMASTCVEKISFSEKQNNLLSHAQTQEKWQLLKYLVLGSDCKTAKLHPLGSVEILTARWTKASFWSRILSYTLFVSYEQDISVEAFGRLDTSSAKNRQRNKKVKLIEMQLIKKMERFKTSSPLL